MWKAVLGVALALSTADAMAASTDFGIRTVGGGSSSGVVLSVSSGGSLRHSNGLGPRIDLRSVAGLGAQWGRVTSTYRSPAHNRRVGGVRNSFHLSGRAIDIARRPGVSHSQIAAAYRNAGYYLVESLDEGDHSHFAFGAPGSRGYAPAQMQRAAMPKGAKVFMAPADFKEPARETAGASSASPGRC